MLSNIKARFDFQWLQCGAIGVRGQSVLAVAEVVSNNAFDCALLACHPIVRVQN